MSKTVLITGASRGIGRETARVFVEQGYRLALHYHHSEQQAQELAAELTTAGADVELFCADIADYTQVQEMCAAILKRFGSVQVLVSNAGIAAQQLFTDITPAQWNTMLNVHIGGAYNCCHCLLPAMIREKQGKIVLVSSIWGITGASCEVHYSTAKAALIGMTKALAKELGPSGIQVNCVAPGVIDTAMNANLDEEILRELADETPVGRLGTPRDVAHAIAFLASPQADFITGQVLSPNGGYVC